MLAASLLNAIMMFQLLGDIVVVVVVVVV